LIRTKQLLIRGAIHLSNNSKEETWKLWDVLFTSGLLSLFKDSQKAENDDKKFKQMLLQLLFGIIFTVSLFAVGFLIFT